MDVLSMINIQSEYNVYYDMYQGKTRTRYLYLKDLNNITKLGSIEKESLENINLDLKYLYNLDLRFALSNEKISTETITKENADLVLEKKRHSFSFENNTFSFDLTEIIKINKSQ